MLGVTEKRWHEYQRAKGMKLTPVKNITIAQALKFYRSEYWEKVGADRLFPGVDLVTYDAGVNSGVSRGRKWLLASVTSNNDHAETVRRICKARLTFVKALPTWKTFGKGWFNRITDVEAKGVVMALAAMGKNKVAIDRELASTVVAAEKQAKTSGNQSKAAGAGAGTGVAVTGTQADVMTMFDWLIVGGITLAFVALVIWLINTRRENVARAKSYREALA